MKETKSLNNYVVNLNVLILFVILNPFIMWVISPLYINICLLGSSFLALFYLASSGLIVITIKRLMFFFLGLIFTLYITTKFILPESNIGKLIHFSLMLGIFFYPSNLLFKVFVKFRKALIFFCYVSVIIFFITLIGIELPYYKIDAFSLVMKSLNAYYRLYGVVVSSTNTVYDLGSFTIMRVCGPFLEPGHFAIYIGFTMILEKFFFNRINNIFIIASLLTFSPSIIFFFALLFAYHNYYAFNLKSFLTYSLIAMSISLLTVSISTVVQEQLLYLLVGRNLESSDNGGGLTELLDDRAGKQALVAYRQYVRTDESLFGKGVKYLENFGVLSDYRGLIFKFGYIGFSLVILLYLVILFSGTSQKMKLMLLAISFIIILHRSWM
ncbi:hypothetical protein, partial [Dokdonia sp. PRO95]|uniref:hypothetical protein n=1 Tax=Dokdonia sp. PRO95 TaxID=1239415 RepID=UPI0005509B70